VIDGPGRMQAARARGAVLFLCLVFLLILGVLGSSAIETSVLALRLARNQQDVQSAFEAAEAALRRGEAVVAALGVDAMDGWHDPAVWHDGAAGPPGAGQYRIEHLATVVDEPAGLVVFVVTGRGSGNRGGVPVLLQSTFGRVLSPPDPDDASPDRPIRLGASAGRLSWRELAH
jgi:Tfp pilus assembly protein PilX